MGKLWCKRNDCIFSGGVLYCQKCGLTRKQVTAIHHLEEGINIAKAYISDLTSGQPYDEIPFPDKYGNMWTRWLKSHDKG